MSFIAIALSSAFLLTTPLLVAERSELLADHATAEPVVSPLQRPSKHTASSSRLSSSPARFSVESPAAIATADKSLVEKQDDDDLVALSKRTDSAVSVSSMAPLSISTTGRFGSDDDLHLIKSPTPAAATADQIDDDDDEALDLALTDAHVDDLLTSPDAPLSFKAARHLLFPEPSLMALPFPTTLMDFAMDGPAVKHALPMVEGQDAGDDEMAAENERRDEWIVKSHAQAVHVGIGFPFGI